MLSNQDLAALTNKLQVPMIVTDILDGEGVLTDDVQYGLHDMMSEFQPDSALLAMALSIQKIAEACEKASPNIQVLGMECERIVADYGELWIKNAKSENVNDDQILDVLAHISEDLETLAEMLELNVGFLGVKSSETAALCEILHIQAKAHALIAEAFMDAVDAVTEEEIIELPAIAVETNKNVIPFPLDHKRP